MDSLPHNPISSDLGIDQVGKGNILLFLFQSQEEVVLSIISIPRVILSLLMCMHTSFERIKVS